MMYLIMQLNSRKHEKRIVSNDYFGFQIRETFCTLYLLNSKYVRNIMPKIKQTNKRTLWPLFRNRSIPTERPPLVDGNLCQLLWIEGRRVVSAADPHGRSQFCRPEPLLFFQISPHLSSQGLSGPRSRPTVTQKIW
jgi:hypothetical protein